MKLFITLAFSFIFSAQIANASIFGETPDFNRAGIFGPLPTLNDLWPRMSDGFQDIDESDSNEVSIFGETPDFNRPGVFGKLPTLDELWPRGSD